MKNSLCLLLILFCVSFVSCVKRELPSDLTNRTGRFIDDNTFEVFLENDSYVAAFSIWIPENVNPRAILVLSTGGGSSALGMINIPEWQDYAKLEKLALVGTYISAPAVEGTYALTVAVNNFADYKIMPELKRLHFLLRGFSAGGRYSYDFASLYSEKTLAFANIMGPVNEADVIIPPGLFIIGLNDLPSRNEIIKKAFLKQRSLGAVSTLSIDREGYHEVGDNDELVKGYFSSILEERLTLSGDIINLDIESMDLGSYNHNETYAYLNYPYDKVIASCLINSSFSGLWLNFALR